MLQCYNENAANVQLFETWLICYSIRAHVPQPNLLHFCLSLPHSDPTACVGVCLPPFTEGPLPSFPHRWTERSGCH